ncbi:hypothetical protein LguiA_020661 [Lonicera macranthoides]
MGGDTLSLPNTSTDEESSLEQEESLPSPPLLRVDDLNVKVEDDPMKPKSPLEFGQFDPNPLDDAEANQRRIRSVYNEVLRSYDELQDRSKSLEEAKTEILSYTPGAWIENVGGMKLSDYNVPKTSSLLLIGPKGSGKSNLINRISRVVEVDKFAPERAQVSYNLSVGAHSVGDGTYFLQEYMIPRRSTSFCLYDTRSLSYDSSENIEMIQRWMTKGVRHGEPVIRDSDSSSLKTTMKRKARQNGNCSREIRMVNFVIFVVNGLSVVKSMDADDEPDAYYTQMIASVFNCPFLSFKDDKPVVVVTHGDLLSLSDRARLRVYLGQLLGVHPKKQIFDISESCDPATDLAIVEMLRYSLEHADRNLPGKVFADKFWPILKDSSAAKVGSFSLPACLLVLIIMGIAIASVHFRLRHHSPPPSTHIDWHTIKHLWLGSDYDY